MTDRRLIAIWPYVVLWLLQIGDLITTAFAISRPGQYEANPIAAATLSYGILGYAVGLALKCGVVALLYSQRSKHIAVFNATVLLSGWYAFVCYNNYIVATN